MPGNSREAARSMMKYPQGDLAILSAEVYKDSALLGEPRRVAATRKTQPSAASSRGSEDVPRKRARGQPAEFAEPEDGEKRARGRPRLDTKDETAADRRRTQIRLAQRAYRNRKETAIHGLEKKVQQLKDTNEDMSNAFMQLHDFALSSGLLDKSPEFGRQLRETTEKFLSLARDASDDDAKEGDQKAGTSRPGSDRARSDSPVQPSSAAPAAPSTTRAQVTPSMISYEPVSQAELTSIPTTLPEKPLVPSFSYEVVTHPTLDNASFPFQSAPGLGLLEDLPNPSPYLSLSSPDTYSSFETTFGRRLQRFSIERALVLISMPDPPQAIINSVFGFCLLLESPATIKRRLHRMLGHDVQQSLSNWQFPFFHLGGAGTHLSASAAAASLQAVQRRFGNQGTLDVLKPGATAGFATGPFSEEINAVRDRELDKDMRMRFPGFAGEYFDCDEAEMYLYQRGVLIPPGAEVVTVEIDLGQFSDGTGGGNGKGEYGGDGWQAGGGMLDALASLADTLAGPGPERNGSSSSEASSPGSGVTLADPMAQAQDWSMGDGGVGLVDPSLVDVFSQGNAFVPATATAETSTSSGFVSPSDAASMLPFGALVPDAAAGSGFSLRATAPNPRRQRVVINVTRLVQELTDRAVCLGRTPGYRQTDINSAFWASAQASTV